MNEYEIKRLIDYHNNKMRYWKSQLKNIQSTDYKMFKGDNYGDATEYRTKPYRKMANRFYHGKTR